jgi:hypothetical protein
MVKNTLNKIYLTDEYEEDDNISLSLKKNKKNDKLSKKSKKENVIDSGIIQEDCLEGDDTPKIEFIVEEDENKEKQIRLNFEFMVGDSNELIKIDLEISKSTYLEIANELLK